VEPTERVIAFATSAKVDGVTDDDQLLASELQRRGFHVEPVVWNAPDVAWEQYRAVIVRSTWDYHLHIEQFLAWVTRLEKAGVRLVNTAEQIRWNADKRYLRDLAERGVHVVPTRWVGKDEHTRLADIVNERGWAEFVVKPSVSASAHRTWRGSQANVERYEEEYRAAVSGGVVLVQPFLDEVESLGEWSLLFYGGAYSHAAIKRPREGDFRVQREHGGTSEPAVAPAEVIEAAQLALSVAQRMHDRTRYARVDGCVVDGAFTVMELELIEPDLFLRDDPDAARRLADVLDL